jgi:hypothetical protein
MPIRTKQAARRLAKRAAKAQKRTREVDAPRAARNPIQRIRCVYDKYGTTKVVVVNREELLKKATEIGKGVPPSVLGYLLGGESLFAPATPCDEEGYDIDFTPYNICFETMREIIRFLRTGLLPTSDYLVERLTNGLNTLGGWDYLDKALLRRKVSDDLKKRLCYANPQQPSEDMYDCFEWTNCLGRREGFSCTSRKFDEHTCWQRKRRDGAGGDFQQKYMRAQGLADELAKRFLK